MQNFLAVFSIICAFTLGCASLPFEQESGQENTPPNERQGGLQDANRIAPSSSRGIISIQNDERGQNQVLRVTSDPENASVYIDGTFYGNTPVSISGLSPGRYSIEIRSEGYYQQEASIDYSAKGTQDLYFALEPIIGYLSIDTNVPARVFIDGKRIVLPAKKIRVPAGSYRLAVESFGYTSQIINIRVTGESDLYFSLNLEETQFSIDSFSILQNRINPDVLGLFSRLQGNFRVSAPGSGTLRIEDLSGTILYSLETGPFTTWIQNFTIQSETLSDLDLPDGQYKLVLELQGNDGTKGTAERIFSIDSSLRTTPSSLFQSISGSLVCADAAVLPKSTVYITSFFAGRIYDSENSDILLLPMGLGARYGISDTLEVSLSYKGTFRNSEPAELPYSISAGIKGMFPENLKGIDIGGYGILSYVSELPEDIFTVYPGMQIGVPVTLYPGGRKIPVSITLTPELSASWTYFSTESNAPPNQLYSWANLRAALGVEYSIIHTALSFSIRTAPFSEKAALGDEPYSGGIEINLTPSSSGTVFSLYLMGHGGQDERINIYTGAGIGIIF